MQVRSRVGSSAPNSFSVVWRPRAVSTEVVGRAGVAQHDLGHQL